MILIRYVDKRWASRERKVESRSSVTGEEHAPVYKPGPIVGTSTKDIVHLPQLKPSPQLYKVNKSAPSRVHEQQVVFFGKLL